MNCSVCSWPLEGFEHKDCLPKENSMKRYYAFAQNSDGQMVELERVYSTDYYAAQEAYDKADNAKTVDPNWFFCGFYRREDIQIGIITRVNIDGNWLESDRVTFD